MRRLPSWLVVTACATTGAAAVIACTTETTKPAPLEVEEDEGGGRRRDSGGSSSGGSSGGSSGTSSGDLEGGTSNGRIYAHTKDTLYLFEPVTKKLTEIGKFDCLGTDLMIDIALDRGGLMFGTAFHKFVSIDPTNAKCTVIKEVANDVYYPNSLSFVPMGTLDATKEVLVGYVQRIVNGTTYIDDYARIDTQTGAITVIGDLNPAAGIDGGYYDVAGDLIALIKDNNKAYAIVKPEPGPDAGVITTNYLAEIDPITGTMKSLLGATNQVNTYGFAYWGGKGYGFSADGRITEINMANGSTTNVLTIDAGGGWYGAGVTTDSPK